MRTEATARARDPDDVPLARLHAAGAGPSPGGGRADAGDVPRDGGARAADSAACSRGRTGPGSRRARPALGRSTASGSSFPTPRRRASSCPSRTTTRTASGSTRSSRQSQRRYLAILDAVDTPWLKAQYDPSNASWPARTRTSCSSGCCRASRRCRRRTAPRGRHDRGSAAAGEGPAARLRADREARRDRPGSERLRPHLREAGARRLRRLGQHRGRRGTDRGGGHGQPARERPFPAARRSRSTSEAACDEWRTLAGKVAVVTGSTQGLGAAVARLLSAKAPRSS